MRPNVVDVQSKRDVLILRGFNKADLKRWHAFQEAGIGGDVTGGRNVFNKGTEHGIRGCVQGRGSRVVDC